MKFINFKNIKDRTSLSCSQMAALISYENLIEKELTVCMINPEFSFKDNEGKEWAKASKLVVIWPTDNKISKIAGNTHESETHCYEAMYLNGTDEDKSFETPFGGLFGLYETLEEAIAEADVCYGATDKKDLDSRKIAFNKVWNKMKAEEKTKQ